ncbi:hypothetical protein [Bacillus atrophaeus]|uniref:hypothetical protein n=1 Tax=Bacillus atrophaeus TaxID=1452 RepID=UPI002E1D70E7|nr:hypothetical protein [Bacillus atrophaeus]MED1031425.1 hypothetical protein [Bacillus atrophaeus]MED1120257.1 hypothetical protein [Bacillus atrophaeus]MED1124613.1 hypothetical protein [Bacillus atrophaeus]MED1133854.1 hypothetical protein [Bacillus atrophaeus]
MAKTKKEAEELYVALKHKYNSGIQLSQRNLSFEEIRDITLKVANFTTNQIIIKFSYTQLINT